MTVFPKLVPVLFVAFVERVVETLQGSGMHRSPTGDEDWSLSVIGVDRITWAIAGTGGCRIRGQPPSGFAGGRLACVPADYKHTSPRTRGSARSWQIRQFGAASTVRPGACQLAAAGE